MGVEEMIQPKSVAEILGGEEVIGKAVCSELELAEVVRLGLWPAAIDKLFDGVLLTKTDMERLVMPRRTLNHRIKKGERLTREESDRVTRVARIVAMAEETFGNRDKASHWLHKSKRRFDGQTPIELLDTEEGARVVEDLLFRIAHGLAA
jgi:putative toxin-antitoxin system antitoxin component (TIGR02293 family)